MTGVFNLKTCIKVKNDQMNFQFCRKAIAPALKRMKMAERVGMVMTKKVCGVFLFKNQFFFMILQKEINTKRSQNGRKSGRSAGKRVQREILTTAMCANGAGG